MSTVDRMLGWAFIKSPQCIRLDGWDLLIVEGEAAEWWGFTKYPLQSTESKGI